ncbi:dihydroxyacetone kinase family protein [Paracoccus pacificus]|uniref:Dihydroxyacetone kinase family protein n=1 Tax=Paracoccus pacificus TaxID=1463598 RepID=A0ABW4RAV0_9RHOB
MKKLINDPRFVVRDLIDGLVATDPTIARLDGQAVILRADIPEDPAQRPVALISGGGSGHEPAHAGYVGKGMLTAAVAGDVFTSPSVDAVLAAVTASAGPAGAVLIVKNYTGDRLNFSLAAEMARAGGIPCEVVFVADDAALRDLVEPGRRRGIAGTVLVHKIAGAAAEAGRDLASVAAVARDAAADLVSMGVGLGPCTVPTAGTPGFELGPDEIEFGLGIHGEKGVERGALLPAGQIVERILDTLAAELGDRLAGPVALMVNGLGGTPPMELAIVAGHALAGLRRRGAQPELVYVGNFMTALEMPGCSLTVLPLRGERAALLRAPTGVRIWPASAEVGTGRVAAYNAPQTPLPATEPGPLTPALKAAVVRAADALVAAETYLTDLDSRAGDGDLGASMFRAAEAMRALPEGAFNDPQILLASLADALRRAIAGSSGPFYATALMRAAQQLAAPQIDDRQPAEAGAVDDAVDDAAWDRAFAAGVGAVGDIGGAKPGDRTMVDALAPALAAWNAARDGGATARAALVAAADAAEKGAEATAGMVPRLGRASYLGARAVGAPDGGAAAVAIWLRALAGK